jgi:hypothetical protein
MSAGTMAKRTPKKKPATPAKARPAPKGIVITIKGSTEWRDWMNSGADFLRLSTATMVDLAVIEYLKAHGFKEPPPKR